MCAVTQKSWALQRVAWALLAGALLVPSAALAATQTVRGTIAVPASLEAAPDHAAGFWPSVENGILPTGPRIVPLSSEIVILLEGGPVAQTPPPATLSMELSGADFSPRFLPIGVGTTVEFKNVDRSAYTLYSPENTTFFGREETAPGKSRRIKFLAPGVFPVRADELPHMEGAVVVVASHLYAKPDERGSFKIENVPEGHYTLRVLYRGAFVHRQPLDVGKAPVEIALQNVLRAVGANPSASAE
jgi:plastocyanin